MVNGINPKSYELVNTKNPGSPSKVNTKQVNKFLESYITTDTLKTDMLSEEALNEFGEFCNVRGIFRNATCRAEILKYTKTIIRHLGSNFWRGRDDDGYANRQELKNAIDNIESLYNKVADAGFLGEDLSC